MATSMTDKKLMMKVLAMDMMAKVMMTMLVVLAIRVESDWVRQVLRSGRKAGSSQFSAVCSVHTMQCAVCILCSMQCATLSCALVFEVCNLQNSIPVQCPAECSVYYV